MMMTMTMIKPYFQPGPLSEILTITDLQHAASSVWTCAKPESGFVEWNFLRDIIWERELEGNPYPPLWLDPTTLALAGKKAFSAIIIP